MQEIRFHGRGGQGTVVAAILLAKAFFQAGFYVQSFPSFGVERRGAPEEAYLRIGSDKILVRTTITAPDHILVQDTRLMQTVAVTHGMQPGGWALLNTPAGFDSGHLFSGFRLASVDATKIAIENGLGTRTHPMVNTAMIGAFARILALPPIDAVMDALHKKGAECIIEGCTEIVMLVDQSHTDIPLFDTTAIHAQKAALLATS